MVKLYPQALRIMCWVIIKKNLTALRSRHYFLKDKDNGGFLLKTKPRKTYHISSINLYVKIKYKTTIDTSLALVIIKYILKPILFM